MAPMKAGSLLSQDADTIAAELLRLSPDYAPTPLLDLPFLADRLGVGQILAKDEGQRMLGSFKSLGGTYAGIRALARSAGTTVAELLSSRHRGLPSLVCASDGNHGLAVAAAARFAGAPARVYLHAAVPMSRARRIEAEGAEVVWVPGTYDDAVDAAVRAARRDGGILVADTTSNPADAVVADVLAGYGVIAAEIRRQLNVARHLRPTHLFVQAGVGGLAAAMAEGLRDWMATPAAIIVVEPAEACCVEAALSAGRPTRIEGKLETAAEMLSCGEASAPALEILLRHDARIVTVTEDDLLAAPRLLQHGSGPATTPSGAAGLAGVVTVLANDALATQFRLHPDSRVLILITETTIQA
jgi:diaminopropionate ammonia-lyase